MPNSFEKTSAKAFSMRELLEKSFPYPREKGVESNIKGMQYYYQSINSLLNSGCVKDVIISIRLLESNPGALSTSKNNARHNKKLASVSAKKATT